MNNSIDFSGMIQSVMEQAQTPGLAFGVVHKDQIIFQQGFGFRDVEQRLPVDHQTLFPIGSSSKAFLGAAFAMLAQSGAIHLDDAVQKTIPEFQLIDKQVSQAVTWRDMLCHRTGMPRHEFVWIPENLSSDAIVKRLAHLPLSEPFRQTFQYCNLMYVAASNFLTRLTKQSFEEYMLDTLFQPLGMNRTCCSMQEALKRDNVSASYKTGSDGSEKLPPLLRDNVLGAGAIVSTIEDMCQWLMALVQDNPTFSRSMVEECIRPNCFTSLGIINFVPNQRYALNAGYGLGWCNEVYRGHRLVHHGGSINGYNALVAFLPDQQYGFVCLHNHSNPMVHKAIVLSAMDQLLDLPTVDWAAVLLPLMHEFEQQAERAKKHQPANTKPPTHDQSSYVGEYYHPGYGMVCVRQDGSQLVLQYGEFQCAMKHLHYNTFQIDFAQFNLVENITFHISSYGDINGLELVTDAALPATQFIKQATSELTSKDYLQQFTGKYQTSGVELEISLALDHLVLHQPQGQDLQLKSVTKDNFELAKSAEVRLSFVRASDGGVASFDLHQFGQVLTAMRCVVE